jgi:hypothetical protein
MPIVLSGTSGITTPTVQTGGIATNLYPLVSGTAQASTSGTSIDFTSIPSWVRRITVLYNGVSTSGSSALIVQIGAGSIIATGYTGTGTGYSSGSAGASSSFTTGFGTEDLGNADFLRYGQSIITNVTGNTWIFSSVLSTSGANSSRWGGGALTLSGTLDRIRITTVNGTDTFDAGTVNIMYE